ncbi:hypothetical protein OAK98_01345 [Mariniblastus sp.]|nr:hypothetical protein [Mariniblastus sp.]
MEFSFKFQEYWHCRIEVGAADFSGGCRGLHDDQPAVARVDANSACAFFRALTPGQQLLGFVD